MANPLNLKRTEMPRQAPEVRAHNFNEVALGYTPEEAAAEASRCLSCVKKNCVRGCPVGIDITSFIAAMRDIYSTDMSSTRVRQTAPVAQPTGGAQPA